MVIFQNSGGAHLASESSLRLKNNYEQDECVKATAPLGFDITYFVE